MKLYWIEGLLAARNRPSQGKTAGVKPFSQSYWANTPEEAIQMAMSEFPRARWIEGPTATQTSEEQRMRKMGAPELPGLGFIPTRKKALRK